MKKEPSFTVRLILLVLLSIVSSVDTSKPKELGSRSGIALEARAIIGNSTLECERASIKIQNRGSEQENPGLDLCKTDPLKHRY